MLMKRCEENTITEVVKCVSYCAISDWPVFQQRSNKCRWLRDKPAKMKEKENIKQMEKYIIKRKAFKKDKGKLQQMHERIKQEESSEGKLMNNKKQKDKKRQRKGEKKKWKEKQKNEGKTKERRKNERRQKY